jgi:hypothetical protein
MTVKKRPAHAPLPAIPLSELRMMKALLATSRPPAGQKATHKPATDATRTTDVTTLRLAIIDKLQILALRRPHALIILAEVLDELLRKHLGLLDIQQDSPAADRTRTKTRVGPRRARHDRR